jgi:hypothetical protein
VKCRGKTNLETYRNGTKYCIHETTVLDYINDLETKHKRAERKLDYLNIFSFNLFYKKA